MLDIGNNHLEQEVEQIFGKPVAQVFVLVAKHSSKKPWFKSGSLDGKGKLVIS